MDVKNILRYFDLHLELCSVFTHNTHVLYIVHWCSHVTTETRPATSFPSVFYYHIHQLNIKVRVYFLQEWHDVTELHVLSQKKKNIQRAGGLTGAAACLEELPPLPLTPWALFTQLLTAEPAYICVCVDIVYTQVSSWIWAHEGLGWSLPRLWFVFCQFLRLYIKRKENQQQRKKENSSGELEESGGLHDQMHSLHCWQQRLAG